MKLEYLLCRKAELPVLLLILLLLTGCGNVGDPLPPLVQIPSPVSDLQALQFGNTIKLSWTIPRYNTDGSSALLLRGIEIYRLPAEALSGTGSGKMFFPQSVEPWRVLRHSELEAFNPGDKLTLIDPLAGFPMDTLFNQNLTYALKVYNKKGQDAGFSNIALTKLYPVPKPPQKLKSVLAERHIEIEWEAPSVNLDESPVDARIKFNVYRSDDPKAPSGKILTSAPVAGDSYKDESIELGRIYYYWVRCVIPAAGNDYVESLDSERTEVINQDVYPPKPPSEVTAISSGEAISLVWLPNTESDLAGYLVYRRGTEKKFEKLSNSLITTASFVDSSASKGQPYVYRIKAIDQKGNESDFSEEVSEKIQQLL